LQNVVERIVSLTEGNKIKLENLPQEIRGWQTSSPKEETESPVSDIEVATLKAAWRQRLWESDERNEIMAMLSRYKGNVSLTARTMGISRNTLYRKIKYYSIYS